MDAALRLGDGHPLHAVDAALVLQPGPDAFFALGLDGDGDVLVAAEVGVLGVDDLGLPAEALGVAQVHPQQVAREQRGLLAALTLLDLHDDVLVIIGVSRDEQMLELLLQLGDALLELDGLLGEALVLGGELLGGGEVASDALELAVGADDGGQLAVTPAERAGLVLVCVHGGVRELLLQLGVLTE
ncbi:hypothetical protein GCM10020219_065840 [Nonomuraea dietziae]